MIDEELILFTLAERMAEVRWPSYQDPEVQSRFLEVSRRVKLFADASTQPACYQAEHGDTVAQVTGMPYKTVIEAKWIIYQNVANDPKALGVVENNRIIKGCYAALAPKPTDPGYPKRNTLGGLVHHCFISGLLFKDPGDIDGQGMIIIPIKILVP